MFFFSFFASLESFLQATLAESIFKNRKLSNERLHQALIVRQEIFQGYASLEEIFYPKLTILRWLDDIMM